MTRVRLFLAILALVLSTHSTAWADHPSDQRRLQELVEALPTTNVHCLSLGLSSVAEPHLEEPDAGIPHVRICGGPGR